MLLGARHGPYGGNGPPQHTAPHVPLTVAYPGGFDYDLTHFIRGLDPGGFLNTLFWWVTFTGSITFMVLITIALYLAGACKEALVFALVFIRERGRVRTEIHNRTSTAERFGRAAGGPARVSKWSHHERLCIRHYAFVL